MAFHKPKGCESGDHHANFQGQQRASEALQQGLLRCGCGPDRPGCADCHGDHEGRKEPIADHHHHQHVVFPREVLRNAVLDRENEGRCDHQADAKAGVILHRVLPRGSYGVCDRIL